MKARAILGGVRDYLSAALREQQLVGDVSRLKRDLEDANTRLDMALSAARQAREEVRGKEAYIDLLQRQAETAADRLASNTALLDDMNDSLEQANGLIAIEQQKNRGLSSRIEELQKRVGTSHEQLSMMPPPDVEAGGEHPEIQDEKVHEVVAEYVYQIRTLSFDQGRHFWQLARGKELIKAPIRDEAFRAQIDKRDVFFAAGDAIRAEFRVITYRRPNGELYARHFVERVIGIVPPEKQVRITALEEVPAQPVTAQPETAAQPTGALS